ncbi:MAG: hypothetical protein ABW149_00015 [Sedimenticola sp.]
MKRLFIVLSLIFLFNSIATAEDKPILLFDGGIKALLVGKDTFAIRVSDQVTGGCLPAPEKLKDKMELSLRRNGFGIIEEPDFFANYILITALGYKNNDSSCAVHISSDLIFQTAINVPYASGNPNENQTLVRFPYNLGGSIMTGDKYSMQSRLEKQVSEFADKLYLDVSRARDEIYKKFPNIEAGIKERNNRNKSKQ